MDRISFRLTGGRLRLTIGRPVLLLSTIGQRTGRVRSTPIFYLRDGTDLVVCNVRPPGERTNPWPRNLDHQPAVEVIVEGRRQRMTARRATQEEIDRLWPRLVRIWSLYADYYQHRRSATSSSSHREAAQKTPDDDEPLRLSDRQPSGWVSLCATQRGLPGGNDLLDIVKGSRREQVGHTAPRASRGNNVPTIERRPARSNPSERPKPALGRVGVRQPAWTDRSCMG
jgi:deazaflavin-dependent oxidoreductase (nitroreductase family)